jgi:hypothetical protein
MKIEHLGDSLGRKLRFRWGFCEIEHPPTPTGVK